MGSERVERFWPTRLRWRMRGAWQWPAFLVLTPVEGLLLSELPPYDGAPRFLGGLLLAGFANLFLVGVLSHVAGGQLRRLRPDLPRVVAADHAGTALLCGLAAVILVAGVLHRPAAQAEDRDLASAFAATRGYVAEQAPDYRSGLDGVDALRLAEQSYRICVPGPAGGDPLCLYVDTDQHPAGVRRDTSTEPNSALRTVGGFR